MLVNNSTANREISGSEYHDFIDLSIILAKIHKIDPITWRLAGLTWRAMVDAGCTEAEATLYALAITGVGR